MKQFKKRLVAAICCLSMTLTMLPAAPMTAMAATTMVVSLNDGYLNLRKSASTEADIVGKLYNGDKVSEISVSGDWSKVKAGGKTGYVKSEYLEEQKSGFSVTALSSKGTVSGTSTLEVRSGPAVSYSSLGSLKRGATVTVTGKASTGWYQISYNGKKAFCSNKYLSLKSSGTYTVESMKKKGQTTSVLNVRSGPSTSYGIVGSVEKGKTISITGKASTGWYQITYDGKKAFLSNDYVKLVSEQASYTVSNLSETAVVKGTTTLTVRTGPSTAYASVGTLKKDAKVTVNGKASTGWYRIVYNGKNYFTSNKYLTIQKKVNVKGKIGVITGDVVNVRAKASTDSKKLGSVTSGTKITLTGNSGNWYQFQYQGQTAYVSADYVKVTNEAGFSVSDYKASGIVVNTSKLNVRSGASADYALVGTLKENATVQITGKASTGWYRITFNGGSAYVSNSYIKVDDKKEINRTGVVDASQLNVRKGPGTSYAMIDTLSVGKAIKVEYQTGLWYHISYDSKSGYVLAEHIVLKSISDNDDSAGNDENDGNTDATPDKDAVGKTGVVIADVLNFRTGPGTDYDKITQLGFGTNVKITGISKDWYKIQVGSTVGYVLAEYITVLSGDGSGNTGSSVQGAKLIEIATEEIGYVEESSGYTKYGDWYGPNMSKVAWCGMFISWCADKVGIMNTVIPKFASCTEGIRWFVNADLWQPRGTYVPKPGDIIFYDWSGGTDPDHVGIVSYVANGKVTAIEGNTTSSVAKRTYSLTSNSIIGYGTPAYTE